VREHGRRAGSRGRLPHRRLQTLLPLAYESIFVLLLALMLQPDAGAADMTVNVTQRGGALKQEGLVAAARQPLTLK
jgi:hypothetical protein